MSREHGQFVQDPPPGSYIVAGGALDGARVSPIRRWSGWLGQNELKPGAWKRPVGLVLLGSVIFLWTLTNFLASTIMADDSYSKPFLITYINTSFFILPLVPALAVKAWRHPEKLKVWKVNWTAKLRGRYALLNQSETDERRSTESVESSIADHMTASQRSDMPSLSEAAELNPTKDAHTLDFHHGTSSGETTDDDTTPLTFAQTARLSLEFCMLWFLANYTVSACLQYTTVASSTILTSTSPLFTLALGAAARVERLTARKVVGVLASLVGVACISSVDLSGRDNDDAHRGTFPPKSAGDLALGDALALLSAVLYGMYSVYMKKRIANEERVDMVVFMGLVGVINVVMLWPGIFLLHLTGLEVFELPPTSREVVIIVSNALGSMVSDFAWAYAVLFTSPILVTVGLTMTIPLSLVGQIIINDQKAGALYWLGACVVVLSFLIVFVGDKERHDQVVLEVPEDVEARSSYEQHGRVP